MQRLWRNYRTNRRWRAGVSLGVHLAYGLYKGALAYWYASAWFAATAVYYLSVAGIRGFLLRDRTWGEGTEAAWRKYRLCGWLLLALTVAIGGVNFYTIRENRAVVYPWHLIYGAAAYTFYSLTVALVRLLRRGEPGPLALADRQLSLAATLMALFSLQAALLAAFGGSGFPQRAWNAATGFAVVAAVTVLAVQMIRRGSRELQ